MFETIGFPSEVPPEEGWTFPQFIRQLKRIQKFAIALAPEEQKGAHLLIDTYKKMGFVSASLDAKRVIYGPSPAEQQLGAFISSSESVYFEINETLLALTDTATWRRRMGSICGKVTYAATPEGFTASQSSGQGEGSDTSGSSKRKKKKKDKTVSFATGTKGGAGGSNSNAAKSKPQANGSKSNQQGGGEVGKNVEKKSIFPYMDGSFSNGMPDPPPFCPTPWDPCAYPQKDHLTTHPPPSEDPGWGGVRRHGTRDLTHALCYGAPSPSGWGTHLPPTKDQSDTRQTSGERPVPTPPPQRGGDESEEGGARCTHQPARLLPRHPQRVNPPRTEGSVVEGPCTRGAIRAV